MIRRPFSSASLGCLSVLLSHSKPCTSPPPDILTNTTTTTITLNTHTIMDELLRDPATIPNAPSLPAHILHQTIGLFFFTLALLPVLAYRTITHFIPRTRPHRSWAFRRSIAIAFGRLYLACTTYLSLPRDPGPSAWKPDNLVRRLVGKGTRVKAVRVQGVNDEWVVSIAKAGGGAVVPVEVPCFWTVCEGGVGKDGDEPAGEGERVIMYVNGGYVFF
jgi:hypothetical protein